MPLARTPAYISPNKKSESFSIVLHIHVCVGCFLVCFFFSPFESQSARSPPQAPDAPGAVSAHHGCITAIGVDRLRVLRRRGVWRREGRGRSQPGSENQQLQVNKLLRTTTKTGERRPKEQHPVVRWGGGRFKKFPLCIVTYSQDRFFPHFYF